MGKSRQTVFSRPFFNAESKYAVCQTCKSLLIMIMMSFNKAVHFRLFVTTTLLSQSVVPCRLKLFSCFWYQIKALAMSFHLV